MRDSHSHLPNGSRELVISFEDLNENGKVMGPLPAGYAGFTWCESAWFVTKGCYASASTSGQVALLNANGADISFEREGPFHLKSLLLASLWEERVEVILEGWAKGAMTYSQIVTAQRHATTQFHPDYTAIDRVNLRTGGAHVLVDNITLRLD